MKLVDKNFSLQYPSAVIFDWDNTLVDSWSLIHESINHALKEFGLPIWSFEETQINIHRSIKDTMPLHFGDKWVEATEVYRSFYRDIGHRIKFLPHADRTLEELNKRHIPIFIISNKKNYLLEMEIEKFGWGKFFKYTIGSGDMELDKPSGMGVEFVLEKISMKPSEKIWFVGDSVTDMETAHNTGCAPIFFGEDDYMSDRYSHCRPKVYFANHTELSKYLSII